MTSSKRGTVRGGPAGGGRGEREGGMNRANCGGDVGEEGEEDVI